MAANDSGSILDGTSQIEDNPPAPSLARLMSLFGDLVPKWPQTVSNSRRLVEVGIDTSFRKEYAESSERESQ